MTQLEQIMSHVPRRTDRFPNIGAAGKVIPIAESAKRCLEDITPRLTTPPRIKKFINSRCPDVGAVRRFHGKAEDPDLATELFHGVKLPRVDGGLVINPEPQSLCQLRLEVLQEAAYLRNKSAPLERSHDQAPGLPKGLDPYKATFGVRSGQEVTAGMVVNPPKTAGQVQRESQQGHELYVRSHRAYFVGEQMSRGYSWRATERDCRFGVCTPHSTSGQARLKCLQWLPHDGKIGSKRCEAFRERTQPQIGKVHDPIGETMNDADGHTFGLLLAHDKYGLGDVLHKTCPETYLIGTDKRWVLVTAVRQQLKQTGYHSFADLLQAFKDYDTGDQGFISKEDLWDVCLKFSLDLSTLILDDLIEFCEENSEGQINYLEFMDFLDWKKEMPVGKMNGEILAGECLQSSAPEPAHITQVQTSGATVQGVDPEVPPGPEHLNITNLGSTLKTPRTSSHAKAFSYRSIMLSSLLWTRSGALRSADVRTYGVPAVRRDLPPPRIRRISDRVNYGDQSTAHGLISPTLYLQRGVHEEHFFSSRTREEIADIFHNVGVEMSKEQFEEAWRRASVRHPGGEVCVELFRNALREIDVR